MFEEFDLANAGGEEDENGEETGVGMAKLGMFLAPWCDDAEVSGQAYNGV